MRLWCVKLEVNYPWCISGKCENIKNTSREHKYLHIENLISNTMKSIYIGPPEQGPTPE